MRRFATKHRGLFVAGCVFAGLLGYVFSGVFVAPAESDALRATDMVVGQCPPYVISWKPGEVDLARRIASAGALQPKDQAQLEHLLKAHQPAIHQAILLTNVPTPLPFTRTPYLKSAVELLSLLIAQGIYHAQMDQTDSAITDFIAAGRVSRSIVQPYGHSRPALFAGELWAKCELWNLKQLERLTQEKKLTRPQRSRVIAELDRRTAEVVPLAQLVRNDAALVISIYEEWARSNSWSRPEREALFARLWLPFLESRRRAAATELCRRHRAMYEAYIQEIDNNRLPAPPAEAYVGRPGNLRDKIAWGLRVAGIVDPILAPFSVNRGIDLVSRILFYRSWTDPQPIQTMLDQIHGIDQRVRRNCN